MTDGTEPPRRARVAVLGAGGIGAAAHLPAASRLHAEADLVAVVDVDEARLRAAARAYPGIEPYDDATAMLCEQKPDVVIVATPPHTHERLAAQVMEAGAWALCEKPLTGSLESVDRLRAVEERTGAWCVTVSQFRYAGGSRQAYDALQGGIWGRILLGVATTAWFRGPEYWETRWRGRFETEFAGATTTQAHHAIDLLLWLMGEWESVSGFTGTLARPIEVEDSSVGSIRFRSGALATIVSTVLSHREHTTITVHAEEATVDLATLDHPLLEEWTVTRLAAGGARQGPLPGEPRPPVQAHQAQLAALLSSWRAGTRPELTVAEARPTLEFLTALYKASATGAVVRQGEIQPGDPFYTALAAAGLEERGRR